MSNQTKPNQVDYRTHTIICGYVRNGLTSTSFGNNKMALELIQIILSYINNHFINEKPNTLTWNIHSQQLQQIFNSNNSHLMSNPITINHLTFHLIATPHKNELLILFLNCIKSQIQFKNILISATIQCNETLYGDSYIFLFENINQKKPFPSYGLLFDEIKNLKSISLTISFKILQIIAINNSILYLHQPKYNITPSMSVTVQLNQSFNAMKSATFGKCFITNSFYNNNFSLRIFPNGSYGNLQSKGNTLIYLQWNGINNILNNQTILWKIFVKDAHITSNGMHQISYNSSFIDCQINTLSFDEFKLYNTFTIVVEIKCNVSQSHNHTQVPQMSQVQPPHVQSNVSGLKEQIISNKLNVLVSCVNALDDRLTKMEQQRMNDVNTLYNQYNIGINHLQQTLTQQLALIAKKCDANERFIRQSIMSLQSQINRLQSNKQLTEIEKFEMWLNDTIKLGQYFEVFVKNGYNSKESVKGLNDNELKRIGIKKIGHRKKLLKYVRNINGNGSDIKLQNESSVKKEINVKNTGSFMEHKSMVNEVEEEPGKQIIFKVSNTKTQPLTQKKLKKINWGHKKKRRREKSEGKDDGNMHENVNLKPKMSD